MTPNDRHAQITTLHAAYVQATGLPLRLAYDREAAWFRFLEAKFTSADLVLVIAHLKRGIAKGERRPNCLLFRNLVENLDHLEEDLAMAKALARKPPVTGRDKALALLRPSATETTTSAPARPVQEISAKVLAEWRAMKERLK